MADLKIKIKGDASSLERAINKGKSKVSAFKNKLKNLMAGPVGAGLAAGAAAIAAIGAAAVGTFNYVNNLAGKLDDLAKAAKRVGVGTDEFQFLSFVANRTGKDMTVVENGMRRMIKTILDAGTGLKRQRDVLAALGLSYKDLQGLSVEDQFKEIAKRLRLVSDEGLQTGIAMELFGSRSGTAMKEIIKAMPELRKQFTQLGATINEDAIENAEKLKDELNDIALQSTALAANSGAIKALASALEAVNDAVVEIKKNFKAIDTNKLSDVITGLATGNVGAVASSLLQVEQQGEGVISTAKEVQDEVKRRRKERGLAKTVNEAAEGFTPVETAKTAQSLLTGAPIGGGGTLASLGGDISGGGFSSRLSVSMEQLAVLKEISAATKTQNELYSAAAANVVTDRWTNEIENTLGG